MMPLFQYDFLLFGLALVPLMILLYFLLQRRKKKIIKKIGDPALVNQLLQGYNHSSFVKKFMLLTAALGMLVLALANWRTPSGANKIERNGIDVMIAVDVSRSMLAQDIKPTRLDRAKQLLSKLIDRLKDDRIGIVVFAGKSYLQMPLSTDHAAAKMYLSSASTESIPTQGTVIGDALKMSYAAFNSKEKKYKAIVLISDGEDHDESAEETAANLAREGVIIHTIGIGSPDGAPIMDVNTGELKTDNLGNTVISRLNESALQAVAKKGKGDYQFFANTDEVVSNLASSFATMDQRAVSDESLINYKSYYQYLLAAALLFLLIELFISETRRRKMSKLKPAVATVTGLMFSISGFAQTDKEVIREGNEAYKQQNYPAAADAYGRVAQKDPANTTAQYNLGNALYKSKKVEESIAAYDKVIENAPSLMDRSKAYYNKGVVLQNNNKIDECISAYKSALKINPNDEDARQNLQKALQKKKEDQQKQDQKKDQDQKDKDQQQKPQQSKLNKKEAEEKLKALMQQEKNLQDKLHKVNSQSPNKPEKDW